MSILVVLVLVLIVAGASAFALWIAWHSHKADDGARDDDVLDRGIARLRRSWPPEQAE